MTKPIRICPDCTADEGIFNRRDFLKSAGVAVAAAGTMPLWAQAADTTKPGSPESLVKVLYESLKPEQKEKMCHDWDYMHPKMGLLRTRVSNNWHINDIQINTEFYSKDQQQVIKQIFEGLIHPEWHSRVYKQLEDDAGGYGNEQNIAIFGQPGDGKFELVMTGRHLTLRCDGNSAENVAFGGPIFYGHDPLGTFNETKDHPQNVYWPQALEANKVFEMLDGKQRKLALVPAEKKRPREQDSGFRSSDFPGIPVTELSSDQKGQVQKTLKMLLDHYRKDDQDEALECLKKQEGLDKCSLAFYQDGDIGKDGVWDCWRLEGPAFVWYFRGEPHVHVWVNVASDPSVKLNA